MDHASYTCPVEDCDFKITAEFAGEDVEFNRAMDEHTRSHMSPDVLVVMLQAQLASAREQLSIEHFLRTTYENDLAKAQEIASELRAELRTIRDNFKRLLGEL